MMKKQLCVLLVLIAAFKVADCKDIPWLKNKAAEAKNTSLETATTLAGKVEDDGRGEVVTLLPPKTTQKRITPATTTEATTTLKGKFDVDARGGDVDIATRPDTIQRFVPVSQNTTTIIPSASVKFHIHNDGAAAISASEPKNLPSVVAVKNSTAPPVDMSDFEPHTSSATAFGLGCLMAQMMVFFFACFL